MAKAQSGFFEFVGDPLFTLWDQFVSSSLSKQLCRNLDNNKACWDDIYSQFSEPLEVHQSGLDDDKDDEDVDSEDLDLESEIHSDSSTD